METSGLRQERLGGFQQRLARAKAGPVPRGCDISVKTHLAGRDAVKQSEKLAVMVQGRVEREENAWYIRGGRIPKVLKRVQQVSFLSEPCHPLHADVLCWEFYYCNQ